MVLQWVTQFACFNHQHYHHRPKWPKIITLAIRVKTPQCIVHENINICDECIAIIIFTPLAVRVLAVRSAIAALQCMVSERECAWPLIGGRLVGRSAIDIVEQLILSACALQNLWSGRRHSRQQCVVRQSIHTAHFYPAQHTRKSNETSIFAIDRRRNHVSSFITLLYCECGFIWWRACLSPT